VATLLVSPPDPSEEELDTRLSPSPEPPELPASASANSTSERFAQSLVLAVLFAVPVFICLRGSRVVDPDIWWHLRTGEWILQHHAVPHVDSLSREFAGRPWVAYSWAFELLVVKLFQWLGLVGLVVYSAGLVMATTVAIFHLVRRLQSDFTFAVLLSFAAMYSMGHLFTPRPWLFTILFFVLELDILMHARRTGKLRELLWLPVLFALWSNLHIQFIDGLLVLALAAAEAILARWLSSLETRIRPAWISLALLVSMLATLLNPYGWHIYRVAYDLATQGGALNNITELQSIPFRDPADFVVLLFALGSAAALAWRRRLVSFESALLVFAAVLSFRSQRDVWVTATVGAAILASAITHGRKPGNTVPAPFASLAAIAAALLVFAGFSILHVNNSQLQMQLDAAFPVRAVETVQQNQYPGPLYNDFNWGGYLTWFLRMPVSVDGRQNLYGDQRLDRSAATWNANPDWASDPLLTSAGVVIGPVQAPLTQMLRADPRFRLAYQDKVAAVFVPATAPR
jgi:hypothetical protein